VSEKRREIDGAGGGQKPFQQWWRRGRESGGGGGGTVFKSVEVVCTTRSVGACFSNSNPGPNRNCLQYIMG
jgi:hypothetical protein